VFFSIDKVDVFLFLFWRPQTCPLETFFGGLTHIFDFILGSLS